GRRRARGARVFGSRMSRSSVILPSSIPPSESATGARSRALLRRSCVALGWGHAEQPGADRASRATHHGARRARKVAWIGLSFKGGTDDVRVEPARRAAIYGSNRRFIEQHLPQLKRLLVSADDALGHGETVVFGHKSEVYLPLLERIRPDQTVFDLAGICG